MSTDIRTAQETARRTLNRPPQPRLTYSNREAGRVGFTGKMRGRNAPATHRALAEELNWREDVALAAATPGGVAVRLASHEATLPAWIHEKAGHLDIGIHVTAPDPPGLLRRLWDRFTS